MEVWKVKFLNVGSSYFPQSRVECHYSINSEHSWSSNDWIGLFKVGWSSVRDYHTFVWSLAPSNYKEGTSVNFCVHFQACYLPRPSAERYQFVYVDGKGEVCACSAAFSFCAPQPLEELVTVEPGEPGTEEADGMLLVVPRAELLQSRLQECLKERTALLQALEASETGREQEREGTAVAQKAWEGRRGQLEWEVSCLKAELRHTREQVAEMKKREEEMETLTEALREEKQALLEKKVAGEQRVGQLEEDLRVLVQRGVEREADLERMKERAKRVATQKKEEENECKNLKLKLERTEIELRSLAAEFQSLRSSLAQRDTHALQLRDTITTLTHKLNNAHRKEAASEAALADLRGVQERLTASERCVDTLRAELRDAAAQRDSTQAELHRARLQAAQLTLQLADASLALREGRATWAQERESLQHNAEVQLSETRRELQELKASLRVAQKEKEQLQSEKQEVMEYIRQLEQRLDALTDCKWSETLLQQSSRPDSPPSDSEDESPEALREGGSTRALSHYGLCEQPGPDALLPATPPPSPRRGHTVVISQPAPFCAPRQASAEAHSSESEEEYEVPQSEGNSSGEETALLLPDHRDTTYSDLVESPLW
ncbi:calcium-binding and coiled-coil domain-containing protein 1 isoform X2 [Electrophorus electricus]|uniref:SKICH domain-containing protein n=1 Tax=Electrophorus electricus TaxID=8005 RepID=A0AAY5F6A1_ELEEL|nr:calcium-binding and coiled-coil domain-containing protein 1 isoform X2 [Electrophorus electricus]